MKPNRRLVALSLAAAGGALAAWRARIRQERSLEPLRRELRRGPGGDPFAAAMADALPEPARRYILRAIAPGTPLARSVRLTMHGAIRLRPDAEPVPMRAEQVLAPPRGLVWTARVGRGLMRIRGFDRYGHGEGALRWWLYGLLPVVRGEGPDVSRSAAGRVAGEAILVPSVLLPGPGVTWRAVDDDTAEVTLQVDEEPVPVRITVDADGRLRRVSIRRWSVEGPSDGRTPGYDRFDVDEFADERTFGGYTIPTRFRAGWRLGEPDESPFFYATVDGASYV